MTDNEIVKAKWYFEYGIKCDIFSEPVLSYAKTVLEAFDEITRQKAEIERLQGEKENCRCVIADLCDQVKTAKAEAVKECTDKLKSIYGEWLYDYRADDLFKGMGGDV